MKLHKSVIPLSLIGIMIIMTIPNTVALQDWQGIVGQFFFPQDTVHAEGDLVTLSWDWFRFDQNGNGTINNLSIYYITRYHNVKQLYLSETDPRDFLDVPNSYIINLSSLKTEREPQTILFLFYMSAYYSLSEQDVLVEGYVKVTWNPTLILGTGLPIPWYIYLIVGIIGSGGILYYIYWNFLSCDNEENFNRSSCTKQREQKFRSNQRTEQQGIVSKEARQKLFEG